MMRGMCSGRAYIILEDAPFEAWRVDGLEGGFVLLRFP